jgi:hypothetical protein
VKKMKTKLKPSDPRWASISMQFNEQKFHAEGDKDEVQAKFRAWLDEQFDEQFSPINTIIEAAQK